MKRLWLKIFAILLTANIGLLLLLYWGFHWSFEYAFERYLDSQTKARFAPLSSALIEEYKARGHWRWVIEEHRVWRSLLQQHIVRSDEETSEFVYPAGRVKSNRPANQSILDSSDTLQPLPPVNEHVPTRSILLYDANGQLVIGKANSTERVYLLPIELDGDIIATLGVRAQSTLLAAKENVMHGHNEMRLLILVGALIALSSGAAFFMATWATLRILRIKEGTRALVRGHYDYRIPVKGKDAIE